MTYFSPFFFILDITCWRNKRKTDSGKLLEIHNTYALTEEIIAFGRIGKVFYRFYYHQFYYYSFFTFSLYWRSGLLKYFFAICFYYFDYTFILPYRLVVQEWKLFFYPKVIVRIITIFPISLKTD